MSGFDIISLESIDKLPGRKRRKVFLELFEVARENELLEELSLLFWKGALENARKTRSPRENCGAHLPLGFSYSFNFKANFTNNLCISN